MLKRHKVACEQQQKVLTSPADCACVSAQQFKRLKESHLAEPSKLLSTTKEVRARHC